MIEKRTTWIELNRSAFDHNAMQFKKILGNAQLGIVIKANAYGHGMLEVASMAESNTNISWYFVATLSEAITLRNQGFQKPILVLSSLDCNPLGAVGKNIDITVYDYETIQKLQAIGASCNYTFNVHVKIDTGLSRLGIEPQDALAFIQKIKTFSHIAINGIFSHFAQSQKKDQTYTLEQVARFKAVLDTLAIAQIYIPYIHLANSAATATLSLPFCNLARVGVGMYGLWSSPDMKEQTELRYPGFSLHPIICWKARITHIKKIPAGRFVGYDLTYQAKNPMQIATIPIGYYDGYDFRLFNKSSMIIDSHHVPVIGRIAMNTTCLDVTNIVHIKKDDEVIIMGDYPLIHPYELGMLAGNPNVREITTKINPSIKRFVNNELHLEENKKLLYTKPFNNSNHPH